MKNMTEEKVEQNSNMLYQLHCSDTLISGIAVAPLDIMAPKYGLISKTNNVMRTTEHVAPLDTMIPRLGLISKTNNVVKTMEHVAPLDTMVPKLGLISKKNNVMKTTEHVAPLDTMVPKFRSDLENERYED